MKLICWNCNCAFRTKYTLLPEADILIIPESESPAFLQNKKAATAFPFSAHLWEGKSAHKGLSIFCGKDTSARIAPFYNDAFKFIVPAEISFRGKNFVLWAVWTQPDGNDSYNGYVVQAVKALMFYEKYLDGDSLIAGDFNSNACWNAHFKQDYNHEKLVNLLAKHGFCSLYHALFPCAHGSEKDATIYMHKNAGKPYYIDYIFAHKSKIAAGATLKIGRYEDWIKYSDHMPLFAEFSNI